MATIDELNERRARTKAMLDALGMMNTPREADEQLKASAKYRLVYEAWQAAEREFNAAIGALSPADLEALANR